MSGRKCKIVEINKKHLTKAEKEDKINAEMKASESFTNLQITPTRHLGAAAAQEYRRIVKDLQNLPLNNLDRWVLDIYCSWYASYKTADEQIQLDGILTKDGKMNLFIKQVKIVQIYKSNQTVWVYDGKVPVGWALAQNVSVYYSSNKIKKIKVTGKSGVDKYHKNGKVSNHVKISNIF